MRTVVALLLLTSLVGCQSPEPDVDPKEKHSLEYIRDMKLEYGLNIIAQKIEPTKVSFDFYHYAEAQPLQARFLIHSAAKVLRKHLQGGEKEIAITISFIDPTTHKRYQQDNVAVVRLLHGKLHYSVYRPDTKKWEEILQEDFVQN